ncbi:MAG: hypothetical protein ACKPKO_13775, partial [Candidatus Fonsibacter sp.]
SFEELNHENEYIAKQIYQTNQLLKYAQAQLAKKNGTQPRDHGKDAVHGQTDGGRRRERPTVIF